MTVASGLLGCFSQEFIDHMGPPVFGLHGDVEDLTLLVTRRVGHLIELEQEKANLVRFLRFGNQYKEVVPIAKILLKFSKGSLLDFLVGNLALARHTVYAGIYDELSHPSGVSRTSPSYIEIHLPNFGPHLKGPCPRATFRVNFLKPVVAMIRGFRPNRTRRGGRRGKGLEEGSGPAGGGTRIVLDGFGFRWS